MAGVRVPREAARRSDVASVLDPGAATIDPLRAHVWSPWIRHLSGRVGRFPVCAPLPDVAEHVVEPPVVGALQGNGVRSGLVERMLLVRPD